MPMIVRECLLLASSLAQHRICRYPARETMCRVLQYQSWLHLYCMLLWLWLRLLPMAVGLLAAASHSTTAPQHHGKSPNLYP